MSAPRSKQDKMIKRFGKMADTYQDKINRQQEIITRLTSALTAAQSGLWSVENEAKDVRAARQYAKQTSAKVAGLLEKESDA